MVNVVANAGFGFLVSESGPGFTWSGNSQANRLTPWSNDPVSDPPGEVIYLRDEESGEVWCPTPLPMPSADRPWFAMARAIRYSNRTPTAVHSLTLLVPPDDPIKLIRLRVQNVSDRPRKLSATYYARVGAGDRRAMKRRCTSLPRSTPRPALCSAQRLPDRLRYEGGFCRREPAAQNVTADRAVFLGSHGSMTPLPRSPKRVFRIRGRGP